MVNRYGKLAHNFSFFQGFSMETFLANHLQNLNGLSEPEWPISATKNSKNN